MKLGYGLRRRRLELQVGGGMAEVGARGSRMGGVAADGGRRRGGLLLLTAEEMVLMVTGHGGGLWSYLFVKGWVLCWHC